jgi:hypothetical protein
MTNDYLLYEKIDQYLKGTLSEEDFYAFEIKLGKDNALKELLRTQRIANEVVYTKQLIVLQTKIQSDLKGQKRWQNYRSFLWGGLIVTGIGMMLYFTARSKFSTHQANISISSPTNKKETNNKSDSSEAKFEKSSDRTIFTPFEVSNYEETLSVDSSTKKITKEENSNIPVLAESKTNQQTPPISILEEQKIDCAILNTDKAVTTTPACIDKQDGKILIDQVRIGGGTAPFNYSMNNGVFSTINEFYYLSPGTYTIFIRDAKNCEIQKIVEIEEKQCSAKNAFAFTPELEKWKIPVKQNKSGILKILNKSGILVYTSEVSSDKENLWDGTSSNGHMLETGYFTYQLIYSDGEEEMGSVSIMHP